MGKKDGAGMPTASMEFVTNRRSAWRRWERRVAATDKYNGVQVDKFGRKVMERWEQREGREDKEFID